jgi:hypothetical protein
MLRDTSYHCWFHTCDVVQFLVYQIYVEKLYTILSHFELLATLIARICNNADYYGFSNVFDVKAETPYGILYKDQSVMVTLHCSIYIDVLSRNDCNLFHLFLLLKQKRCGI